MIMIDALPDNPLDALRELTSSEHELERLRREAVRAARADGATWEQIGEVLGTTRQSAWEYFTRSTRESIAANAAANVELTEDEAMELAVAEVRASRRVRRSH